MEGLTLQSLGNTVLNGFTQIANILESLGDGYEVLAYKITETQDILQGILTSNTGLLEMINILTDIVTHLMYQTFINSFLILFIIFYLIYQHFTRR